MVTSAPSRLPRVLIVNGQPASAPTAEGITLGRLFQDWPRERFAQVYTSALPHALTGAIDYHVPANSRRHLAWLNLPSDSAALLAREADGSQAAPDRRGRAARLLAAAKLEARRWLDLFPYELPREIEQQIVDFRPHLIYSCLGNIQISRLALRLANLCRVPVIPHFMDDWISTQYMGRPDLAIHRALLVRSLDAVLETAPFGLTISGVMAAEYSAKFGRPFYAFMNCVHTPAAAPLPPPHAAPRLVYVGCLHLARWRALREIGDALVSLNREKIAGTLTIYAPAADLATFGDKLLGSGIEIGGSLSQAEVPAAIAAADVLVHVESFDPKMRRYTRLSISTKIPQYAAAARPLFCYGPQEVASLRFVHENAFGLIAGSQEGGELKSQLRRILQDSSLRQHFAANAIAVARRDFDAVRTRARFRSALTGVGQGNSRQPVSTATPYGETPEGIF